MGCFSPQPRKWTLTTGQKYDAEYDVADDLTDLGPMLFRQTPCTVTKFRVQRKMAEVNYLSLGTFSSELSKGAATTVSSVSDIAFVIVSLTEYSDSDLESNLKKPTRMRSNTTTAGDLEKIVFLDVILPGACPVCPRILTTSPNKRQIRSVQQSLGKFVGIEYNTEENDDMLEDNYHSTGNKFERFRGFLELISRFEFEFCRRGNYFFEGFEFLVCSCECAVAFLCPRNSISNVVVFVTIHDDMFLYVYIYKRCLPK